MICNMQLQKILAKLRKVLILKFHFHLYLLPDVLLGSFQKPISYLSLPNVLLDSYCQILMLFYVMDIRSNKHLLDKHIREQ